MDNGTKQWTITAMLGFCLILPLAALAAGLNRTTLEVRNISCGSCLSQINTALTALDGFSGISADLYQGKVTIDHQTTLSPSEISRTITGLGYPARILKETEVNLDTEPMAGQANQGDQEKWYSKGVGNSGCNTSHSCGGTASAWQEFYSKYFGKGR
jgi:copper chaperone CopZ